MILTTLLIACAAGEIETRRGPDVVDVESTRVIRESTTEQSFLTSWVDYVPESDTVPSPRDALGYAVGTPGRLTQANTINDYFRRLADTSDRVTVFPMGRSHGGREMIIAAIADPAVLARLDEIKAANHALADPRRTTRERAAEIAASVPVTYWITSGLHSPETGPPEMVMELAYRLAVSEQEHIREIRENVLTLISPVLEMDGRARMVDWYDRFLTGVTDIEDSPPFMAPYWGDYTAHDNNRDGLQVSQPLTRNYTDTYHEFLPTVSLDLHESVPLLYTSMGTGPYNDTIDPITVTEWLWLSSSDVSQATRLGLRGVWTWGFYTGWYPGYLLWVTNNHNAVGRFYETFGNSNPGTFTRDLKHATYADERINSRQWYRPWPPEKELRWSLRNNTNYMQTGVLAALQLAARNGDTLLMNYWQKGANSLGRGTTEPPYAFVVPREQRDRGNLDHLLWLLKQHRVEVHEATYTTALTDDLTLNEGDYVVRMDQPYRNFSKTLLMKQDFPKTAELSPYDDIAWSLDYMLGVEIHPIDDRGVLGVDMTPVTEAASHDGRVDGDGPWIIDHNAQSALAGLRWGLGDVVRALAVEWDGHPAGSLLVNGVSRNVADELATTFNIDFAALRGSPDVATVEVDLPRVAMFHTWRYTQDSGWARYTLEQQAVPYTLIDKDDLRAGRLADRFDVIVVPDQGWLRFKHIVHGIDEKWSPMPYTQTDDYPSHGVIDSSPDITGGMGFEGLSNLQSFVEGGGLLITLGSSGRLVADGGIARHVSSSPAGGTPGSHVTTKVLRPEHPVTWGFDETCWVFHGNDPGFGVHERWQGMVVMQYGTKTMAEAERDADRKADIPAAADDEEEPKKQKKDAEGESKKPALCLSGLVKDPSKLERKPAILDVPVGKGRVLVYSWNPLHRYQNLHDFPFLTNALLFHNDFPPTPTEKQMRDREASVR